MRNADETKVLELQFENKDFEKNATQSISTIEKLKESLDFSGSTKGLEDINSNIKAVNFSNLTNGIKEATNGFSMMEVIAFGVFNRLGGRIADFAVNTLGKLFSYVPSKILQGGFNRATNVDRAEFLLEGMNIGMDELAENAIVAEKYLTDLEKEEGKVGKAFDTLNADINSAVSGTAFGFDQAAKAAAQLSASGIAAGDEMRATLQGISGVAAMTNSSYDEIAYVFTKVAAAGKAMNGEMRMLSDRGLPVTSTIANYMNDVLKGTVEVSEDVAAEIREISGGLEVTEADVVELASKSKISFRTFRDALFEAYSDQAFKANSTYEGVISNIGSQLARIGEIFAGPFREDAIPVLQKVYDIIKKVRDIVNNSLFAAGVIAAMKKISDALVFALTKVDNFLGKVKEIQSQLDLVSKVKNLFGFGEAADEAEEAAEKISGSFEEVRDTALKVIKGDWGNGMARMQALTEAGFDAQTIQDYVNALWEVTGHDWSKVFDEDVQKQAWAMLDLSDATEKCAENGQDLAKQQREEQKALREAVHQLPKEEKLVLSIANAFLGAQNIFDGVKKTFSEKIKMPENVDVLDVVSNKVYDVSQSFADFTTKHGDEIASVFGGIYDAVMLVVDGFSFVGKAIYGGVTAAFSALGLSIWDVIVNISSAITNIRNWVTENKILELAIGAISSAITTVVSTMKGWWDSFKALPGVDKVLTSFSKTFTKAFGPEGSKDLTRTTNAIKRFCKTTKTSFKLLSDKKLSPKEFFEQIRVAWAQLTNTINDLDFVKNIKASFSLAKDAVKDWVKELGNNEDGTRNTFGKITDTVNTAFNWIGDKAKGVWTSVTDFFKVHEFGDFFGDNFTMLRGAFTRFFDSLPGFATGLKGKWQEFLQKVTDLGGFKFENIGQIWQAFQDTIGQYWKDQDIFAPIKSAFELVKNSAKDKLREVGIDVDAIIAYVQDIPNKIKEYFTNDNGEVDVGYGINKMIESIKTAFSTGKTTVEGEGKSLIDTIISIPGKIYNFFTDEEGNLDIPGAISSFFSAVLAVFTGEDVQAAEVKSGEAADGIIEGPTKIKNFFEGWSVPEAFSSFIGVFTSVDEVASDKSKKTNMTDLGDKFQEFASKVKEGFSNVSWDGIAKIAGLIGAFSFIAGATSIMSNVRKVVEAITNTFGEKAEARNLTAMAVLKIAAAIGIVAIVIDKLKAMFEEDPLNTGRALASVLGIGAILAAMSGWTLLAGIDSKLSALSGLGDTLEAIGIAVVVAALKKIQDANLTLDTYLQAGVIAASLTALSAIGVAAGAAGASPIGLLVSVAGLLTGVNFMVITQSIINLAQAIDTMKGLKESEAKTAATNFTKAITELFNGLSDIEISPDVESKVNKLSNIVSLINGLGKKTAWSNVLGTAPQRGIIGAIKSFLTGTGENEQIESNAAQVNTTVEEVAGVVETWNQRMKDVKIDTNQLDGVEQLVRVISHIEDYGWANFLFGAGVSDRFVNSMGNLADGIKTFYTNLTADGGTFDADLAKKAADVAAVLGRISDYNLENTGNFKKNAGELAEGVNTFVAALDDIDNPELAKTAADLAGSLAALMDFATVQSLFQYDVSDFLGNKSLSGTEADKNITAFNKFDELATQIKTFITDVSGIEGIDETTANLSTISEAVDSMTTIDLSNGDIITPSKVTTFIDHIEDISAALLNAASTAWFTSAGIDKLKENAEKAASIDLDGSKTGEETGEQIGSGLEDAGETVAGKVTGVMKQALDSVKSTGDEFAAAGKSLMIRVANGFIDGASRIKPSASSAASAGAKAVRGEYNDFKSAGAYLADGFAIGMERSIWKVRLKAQAMARAAKDSAKRELDERSPSKEGRKIGAFFGEGFALGIADYNRVAYDTARDMAKSARQGLNKAVKKINDIVTGNLDAAPVIRPVLDLSEIQNGAMSISSLLDTTPSVALSGNLGAINASMTNRTDPNAGIIAALDSLRDNLNTGGDTYNINGVTYDDGSNIADAVGTLIRAAKVERRV